MRLTEIVEGLDLPDTRVAEGAWEQGVRRVRRRRLVVTGSAVGAALVVAALAPRLGTDTEQRPTTPPVATPSTGPSTGPSSDAGQDDPAPITAAIAMPRLTNQKFGSLVDASPVLEATDATLLSDDPVDRAVLAMSVHEQPPDQGRELGAYVLGDDGGWRKVDVAGMVSPRDEGGYAGSLVGPTSLDPDGRQLAVPQPDGLIVVDLTTGTHRSYVVPGPANHDVIWQDEGHVVVSTEGADAGTEVDLDTGALAASAYGPTTRFLDDGTALTWLDPHGAAASDPQLTWNDGTTIPTAVSNGGGLQQTSPLVDADVAVGLTSWPDAGSHGVAVVDRRTGDALAFQPTVYGNGDPTLLLGFDGDAVLLALQTPAFDGYQIVSWDWRARTVDPVAVARGYPLAWGGPVADLPD